VRKKEKEYLTPNGGGGLFWNGGYFRRGKERRIHREHGRRKGVDQIGGGGKTHKFQPLKEKKRA